MNTHRMNMCNVIQYVPTYVRTYVCMCALILVESYEVRTYIHIHTYICTYTYNKVHTYIHKYVHTYIRTCIHIRTFTYVCTYIHTYICMIGQCIMYIRMYGRTILMKQCCVPYVCTNIHCTYVRAQHMTVSSLQAHCAHPHEQSMAVVDGVPQLKGKHGVCSSLAELVPQLVGCQPVPV